MVAKAAIRSSLAAAAVALALPASAHGAVFTVTTTADGAAACTAIVCTLRSALQAAQANGSTEDDTIMVPAGTFALPQGDLGTTGTRISVRGAGANLTVIQAAPAARALTLTPPASLELSDVTLRDGSVVTEPGGNILLSSNTKLQLTRVRVTEGSAPRGGGIAVLGGAELQLAASLIDHNSTAGSSLANAGGGIYVEGQTLPASVTIRDSTITRNVAANGGGLAVVNNSGRNPVLHGVTLAFNIARVETGIAGVHTAVTTPRFQGSIVTANLNLFSAGSPSNCSGTAVDEGGNVRTDDDCGLGGIKADPRLAQQLVDGYAPPALPIAADSPALDVAECGTRTRDQRGMLRPQGPKCDAGAFEVEVTPTPAPSPSPTADAPTATPTPLPTASPGPPPIVAVTPNPTSTPQSTATPAPPRTITIRFGGAFRLPPGFTRAQACRGRVKVDLRLGRRVLASTTVRLDRRCRYVARFTLARSRLRGARVVTIAVRFAGNRHLGPASRSYKHRVPA